jgi:retron-type reverse transcriptase
MGSPKGFYTYGDRVTIVADFSRYGRSNVLRRRRVTVNPIRYSTGSANTVMNKMESLNQFSKTNPGIQIDRKLFNLLCNPDILYRAYQNIKSKPGYMTPGVDETLDGISYDIFIGISSQLKSGTFKFKPIQIPKPNGKVRRIENPPRDKIVQEAIRMILNAIYEPLFLEHSHGFRPNRSCHTALKYIYAKFKPVT